MVNVRYSVVTANAVSSMEEWNSKCRELILHRQRTAQPKCILASVTSRRSRRRSEFTVAPPARTQGYSHTQARDNVVLRIGQQAHVENGPRQLRILYILVRVHVHTPESERKKGEESARVCIYGLLYVYVRRDRARGTRRRPEARRSERPAELWTHSGFLRVVPALAARLKGKGSLLYWIGLHDLRYRLPISLDHRSLSGLTRGNVRNPFEPLVTANLPSFRLQTNSRQVSAPGDF